MINRLFCPAAIAIAITVFVLVTLAAWMLARIAAQSDERIGEQK